MRLPATTTLRSFRISPDWESKRFACSNKTPFGKRWASLPASSAARSCLALSWAALSGFAVISQFSGMGCAARYANESHDLWAVLSVAFEDRRQAEAEYLRLADIPD